MHWNSLLTYLHIFANPGSGQVYCDRGCSFPKGTMLLCPGMAGRSKMYLYLYSNMYLYVYVYLSLSLFFGAPGWQVSQKIFLKCIYICICFFCASGWQESQKYSWNAFLHLGHNGSLDRQSSSRQCSEVLQNLFGISGSLDVEIMLNYRGSNAKPKVSGVETLQKNTTRLILRWTFFH